MLTTVWFVSSDRILPVKVCPVSASRVIVAASPTWTFGASVSVNPTLTSRLETLVSWIVLNTPPCPTKCPWAERFGGSNTATQPYAVATDATGNIVVVGSFRTSTNLGGANLNSAGGLDVFVAKYSPSGAHLWSKRFGGNGDDSALSVTLASTADIVPLVDENRVMSRIGMELINTSPRPGIKALIEGAGLKPGTINTGQIVFVLAPRINAVGRLGDAMRAVRLLTSTDPAEAGESFAAPTSAWRRAPRRGGSRATR